MKQSLKFLVPLMVMLVSCNGLSISADDLRCEYLRDPSCIDQSGPMLSWIMESNERNDIQTAYRIIVSSSREKLAENDGDMWDTGKVPSGETSQIPYEGDSLQSGMEYWWKVMIWNRNGTGSEWSSAAKWTMGLLDMADWKGARWIAFRKNVEWRSDWDVQKNREAEIARQYTDIGKDWPWWNGKDSTVFSLYELGNYDPSPLFRKSFHSTGRLLRATLYICGLGYYIPYLNGQRIGDRELNPAWTNYDQRALYDAYDVTDMIADDNTLGVMLGRGQYCPICNDIWGLSGSKWVDQPKLIALLKLKYEDGKEENIITDDSWDTAPGPVVYDDTRHGELYDAREEKPGWNTSAYDASRWRKASVVNCDSRLEAQAMPPIRKSNPIKPIQSVASVDGSRIYDIGRQIAGWARVRIKGKRGTRVLVEYCETPSVRELLPDLPESRYQDVGKDPFYASFYDRNNNIRQQNGYIMKGEGTETVECMFSYKGFRYLRVWADNEIETVSVEGIPVHTDFEPAGYFSCSDEVVNTIQNNAVNSMLSNFMGIPTDCPHREKQGWTCDTYIVSRAAMYNFQMQPFFSKWIADLAGTRNEDGGLNIVAPSSGGAVGSSTTWPAAIVYVPYDMYCFYRDSAVLRRYLPCMEEFAESSMGRQIEGKQDIIGDILGDWISPHKEIDDSAPRQNDMAPPEGLPFYGSSSHFRVHDQLAYISKVLRMPEKEAYYNRRAGEIADRFNAEFYTPEDHAYHGTNPSGYRQSMNATALYYGLVPETEEKSVEEELVRQIYENDSHLSTGFLGTQSLIGYLSEKEPELTYTMVTQPTYPSWGYMVSKGATGTWESWDGYDSHNHLPFCMISEYFYRNLAGIRFDPDCAGFRHIIIRPSFIRNLDYVRCHYDAITGRIESNWKRKDGKVMLDVRIPANTTATVCLPDGNREIGSGTYSFTVCE